MWKKIIAGGAENICSYVVSKIGGTTNKIYNFKLAWPRKYHLFCKQLML